MPVWLTATDRYCGQNPGRESTQGKEVAFRIAFPLRVSEVEEQTPSLQEQGFMNTGLPVHFS
jgi:hypothetical protein